jgi:glyoxylate/hydroxypyruvate reductase A
MALVFFSDEDDPVQWRALLEAGYPGLEVRVFPAEGEISDVEYALVSAPPAGLLARYRNLKAIFSLWAGIEHILRDPGLPPGIPIVRMVSGDLTRGMVEYVAMHCLRYARRLDDYQSQQRNREWRVLETRPDMRVCVLGLGVLGSAAAAKLASLGFRVSGWSRSRKSQLSVESFSGQDELLRCLSDADIAVCLLPLTGETHEILNLESMSRMPRGSYLINAARGAHIVDGDLLALLGTGHLAGATLDVFRHEPLPQGHPFWSHPNITITPHIASTVRPCAESAAWVVRNIQRIEHGGQPLSMVNRALGY